MIITNLFVILNFFHFVSASFNSNCPFFEEFAEFESERLYNDNIPSLMSNELPVDKPSGKYDAISGTSDNDSDSEELNYLISKIPKRFFVSETSGIYKFDSEDGTDDDYFETYSQSMLKRSFLYKLLAEIYIMFDTMDLEGFLKFLEKFPDILHNQSLKYSLISNLMSRSLKTENQDTLRILSQFISSIDSVSIGKSVGKYEKERFFEFEKMIEARKDSVSNRYPDLFDSALEEIVKNERSRYYPLRGYFSTGDYASAKRVIESSSNQIFMSADDFMYLLEQECTTERYNFVIWAIINGHFNVHEKIGNSMLTPLMLAAKSTKWSNDIVKAILSNVPSTILETDLNGKRALYYAVHNHSIGTKSRRVLVGMLQLDHPTPELLDQISAKNRA